MQREKKPNVPFIDHQSFLLVCPTVTIEDTPLTLLTREGTSRGNPCGRDVVTPEDLTWFDKSQ